MFRFRSYLLAVVIAIFYFDQVLSTSAYNEDKYGNRYFYQKDFGSKLRNIPESSLKGKGILGKFSKYKEEVETATPHKKAMFKAADFESGKSEPPTKKPETKSKSDSSTKAPPKIAPIRQNETEAEKAERIHRTFEKLLTFVEIVGQVDNYVSTKWKNLVRTVSNMYEEESEDDYRLGLRRDKGCPIFLKEN